MPEPTPITVRPAKRRDEKPATSPDASTHTETSMEEEGAPDVAVTRVREQFNAHDAKSLAAEIDRMKAALAALGYQINEPQVKAAADAQAALEILVALGLVSHEEVQARAYRAARSMVAVALQQAEEATLQRQQQARTVQPVRNGPIVIARQ